MAPEHHVVLEYYRHSRNGAKSNPVGITRPSESLLDESDATAPTIPLIGNQRQLRAPRPSAWGTRQACACSTRANATGVGEAVCSSSSALQRRYRMTEPGLRVGERLGVLRLERRIGEGGMGTVYEASNLLLGRREAVKLVLPELARNPDLRARFRREAEIAHSLENEHIVRVKEYGSATDGTPYLVMDLLEGLSLRALLDQQGPLPVARTLELVLQACQGLRVAHEHRPAIVHRDVKPENLFICRGAYGTECLKILDFGIAKLMESTEVEPLTRTGNLCGTPHYMSPEQVRSPKTIDQRTDVYALGVVLYEALSGAKPHPGDSYNEILSHVLLKDPIPLDSFRADLAPPLVKLVHRAIESDVSKRFQSVAELAKALIRCQRMNEAPLLAFRAFCAPTAPRRPGVSTLVSDMQDTSVGLSITEHERDRHDALRRPGTQGIRTAGTKRLALLWAAAVGVVSLAVLWQDATSYQVIEDCSSPSSASLASPSLARAVAIRDNASDLCQAPMPRPTCAPFAGSAAGGGSSGGRALGISNAPGTPRWTQK